MPKPDSRPLMTITYALALTIMLGWMLRIGQQVLLPVMVGIISVYVLVTAAEAMSALPGIGRLSRGWRRLLVLVVAAIAVLMLGAMVASNAASISAGLPGYVENLDRMQMKLVTALGLHDVPSFAEYAETLLDTVDLVALLPSVLSSISGSGTVILAAVLYATFLLADLDRMPDRVRRAMDNDGHAEATLTVVRKINQRIGDYLAAKTLINIVLGGVSWAVMLLLGIEHAVFWAVLIALLNYIPYVGSIIAVAFPVTMSLVQYVDPLHSVLTLIALFVPQTVVGYYVEPKVLGKSVNLNPFVVLLALSVWTALWGMTGAVMAVPLTAMVAIVLAEFDGTRFLAVLLSDDGEV